VRQRGYSVANHTIRVNKMTGIAFIGLGHMGLPMARNLVRPSSPPYPKKILPFCSQRPCLSFLSRQRWGMQARYELGMKRMWLAIRLVYIAR